MINFTQRNVVIVGAGLSGLLVARQLQMAGYSPLLLEARNRIGGRILSVSADTTSAKFDLGPTWVWSHHQHILRLLNELNLQIFPQFEDGLSLFEQNAQVAPQPFKPDWQQPISYRIVGGIGAIIDCLAAQLPPNSIRLNQTVTEIIQEENGVRLVVEQEGEMVKVHAQHVVVTLPPHLAATTIRYQPTLPAPLHKAMTTTPTWMGMAMKIVLSYDKPFWRACGLSGYGISYAGPVAQFHDASPHDDSVGALFGWIGDHSSIRGLSVAERKTAVTSQAVRLFGEDAANPRFYDELNWAQEAATTNLADKNPIAQEHPSYGHPLLQEVQMNGRLHWAVTEASPVNGGYLDGAVFIAQQVGDTLLANHLSDLPKDSQASKVSLRNVAKGDLALFFDQQLDSDANYMAAFTSKEPANRKAFDTHWDRILADKTIIIQTILSGEQVVGYVLSYETDGKPEVSYWIGKAYWGKGIVTRALSAFLAHTNQTRPIYARVAKDNLGSIRVLRKCGFKIISEVMGFANARGEEIEELIMELAGASC